MYQATMCKFCCCLKFIKVSVCITFLWSYFLKSFQLYGVSHKSNERRKKNWPHKNLQKIYSNESKERAASTAPAMHHFIFAAYCITNLNMSDKTTTTKKNSVLIALKDAGQWHEGPEHLKMLGIFGGKYVILRESQMRYKKVSIITECKLLKIYSRTSSTSLIRRVCLFGQRCHEV